MDNIIEEIHKEFDTSYLKLNDLIKSKQEEIIKSSEKLSSNPNDDVYTKLGNLGFSNIPILNDIENTNDIKNSLNNDGAKIEKYKSAIGFFNSLFPVYKYIDLTSLYKILEKYNLYVGSSGLYKGDIPVKNANDIIRFDKYLNSKAYIDYYDNIGGNNKLYIQLNIDISLPLCYHQENSRNSIYNKTYPYYIVAPKSDFIKKGTTTIEKEVIKFDNPKILDIFAKPRIKVIKDPVVLKPFIFNGIMLFAIVTKWGLEAEIDEFQNKTLEN